MKIGNVELTGNILLAAVSAAVLIFALMVYCIIFSPLITGIRVKCAEAVGLEKNLCEARDVIESCGKTEDVKTLKTEEDISKAIDELTRHGKSTGVKYISIKPKEQGKDEAGRAILPVEMEIDSTYEQLAVFLGSLDELNDSIVKVKNFDIAVHKNDPALITANLVVAMYLSGG